MPSYKEDLLEFLSFVFNCVSSESTTAINNLYTSFVHRSLELNPMFQDIIKVQRAILEGREISSSLPALVKMIGKAMKIDCQGE